MHNDCMSEAIQQKFSQVTKPRGKNVVAESPLNRYSRQPIVYFVSYTPLLWPEHMHLLKTITDDSFRLYNQGRSFRT